MGIMGARGSNSYVMETRTMTRVAILSVPVENGSISYCAMAGDKRSFGHTAGEALDLLTSQLAREDAGTLVIVQSRQPDRFFDARQQRRLGELMNRFCSVRTGDLP